MEHEDGIRIPGSVRGKGRPRRDVSRTSLTGPRSARSGEPAPRRAAASGGRRAASVAGAGRGEAREPLLDVLPRRAALLADGLFPGAAERQELEPGAAL